MEFERAIFRVHERCLESLRDDGEDGTENINLKTCRVIELIALLAGIFLLFCLLYLHIIFVGSAGCISHEMAFLEAGNSTFFNHSDSNLKYEFKSDQLLGINLDESSLSGQTSQSNNRLRSKNLISDDASENRMSRRTKRSLNQKFSSRRLFHSEVFHYFSENASTSNSSSTSLDNSRAQLYMQYDYLFAFDPYILFLPDNIKQSHHFDVVNITLSGSRCFGGVMTQSFLPLAGLDTIIMNNLMFTFRKPGYFIVAESEDFYRWGEDDIDPYSSVRKEFKSGTAKLQYALTSRWLQLKLGILFNSFFSFFLLSSVTALLVRMLISSGVVLLFPIFWMFQLFGMHAINLRIISMSYPWIGLPMEMLRTRNQPSAPFVLAHISRVLVYYCLYAAAQVFITAVVYIHFFTISRI